MNEILKELDLSKLAEKSSGKGQSLPFFHTYVLD